MTEYEYLMEKRAATDVETRKVKLSPADPDWIAVEQISGKYNDDASKAILKYKKSPTAENLKDVVTKLRDLEKANPAHLHGGFYAGTKDTASRAREMFERGNYTRGLIGALLGTPLAAGTDTIALPVNLVSRALRPSINTRFKNINELAEADPLDLKTNLRSANELFHVLRTKRPNPTSQGEGLNTLISNWSGAFYTDAPSAITGSLMSPTIPGGTPGVAQQLGDILSIPHTALFNALDWNGIPREEWEKLHREKSASADLAALKNALREYLPDRKQIRAGVSAAHDILNSPAGYSVLGGLVGASTGHPDNEKTGQKGTRLRNAAIGALLGGVAGEAAQGSKALQRLAEHAVKLTPAEQ